MPISGDQHGERGKHEQAVGAIAPDPVVESQKDAPWDDEPLKPGDKEAIEEANADYVAGRVVSQEDLRKELSI